MVPSDCSSPAAWVPAIPSARPSCSAVRPSSLPAAATAPKWPSIAVTCQPRSASFGPITRPIRVSTSKPATNASMTAAPGR